jgi:hypothetical protein
VVNTGELLNAGFDLAEAMTSFVFRWREFLSPTILPGCTC